jgi:hypothetical protein
MMKKLHKRTLGLEQSIALYASCSCTCRTCNSCGCYCDGTSSVINTGQSVNSMQMIGTYQSANYSVSSKAGVI